MSYQTITVETGPLATITVAREKALNALSPEVGRELDSAVAALEADDSVRVVAITGAGVKAFVAGADIAAMQSMGASRALEFADLFHGVTGAIQRSKKIYIAAVNGFALGGGCELAMACDFIYASDNARFGQPEVKLGVIPGFGGTQRLARRVGIAKAKELCVTGEMLSAAEALRIGLADVVVSQGELMARVQKTADAIAKNGPLAVAACKRLIDDGVGIPLDQALTMERLAFATLFDTGDQKEGMAAFLEKRSAEFKGQ